MLGMLARASSGHEEPRVGCIAPHWWEMNFLKPPVAGLVPMARAMPAWEEHAHFQQLFLFLSRP